MVKKLLGRMIEFVPKASPVVGIICPSCDSEVGFNEIIEKKGSIRCINCIKR